MKNTDTTYRERFARTLAHQPVDRPPMDLGASDMTEIDGAPRRLAPLLGIPAGTADPDEAVLQALPSSPARPAWSLMGSRRTSEDV